MSACTRSKFAEVLTGLKQGVLLGAAAAMLVLPPSGIARLAGFTAYNTARASSMSETPQRAPRADFGALLPSADARHVADWVVGSSDNKRLPFAILDKRGARVYVFDAQARLIGSSLVLLGSAVGDDSVVGIGNRPLSQVHPTERTTAAGRFVSEPGHDETGDKVVWVDYDAALAMHRVKIVDPKERRFERLATDSIDDKRISNGCINVPIAFFDSVVEPALGQSRAIVYVLPEVKPLQLVFPDAYQLAAQ
jgi:hypothetical protein